MCDDDEFVFTTELVTKEQVEALRRLLALPYVEGFSVTLDDEMGEDEELTFDLRRPHTP